MMVISRREERAFKSRGTDVKLMNDSSVVKTVAQESADAKRSGRWIQTVHVGTGV